MRIWFARRGCQMFKWVVKLQRFVNELTSKYCANGIRANDKHISLVAVPPPFVGFYSSVEVPPGRSPAGKTHGPISHRTAIAKKRSASALIRSPWRAS